MNESVSATKCMTIEEAASISGFKPKEITRAVKKGMIPAVRLGRRIMLNRGSFEAFLAGSSTDGPKAA